MFNETQISLLKEARSLISSEQERFICCAINTVVQSGSVQLTYDMRYADGFSLKEQIDFGIDGRSCLELWLFAETGIYPCDLKPEATASWENYAKVGWLIPMKRLEFNELLKIARLAWIDRALETGSLM